MSSLQVLRRSLEPRQWAIKAAIKKDVKHMDRLVTIKSSHYGLEIHLDPAVPFEALLESMERKLRNSSRFFEGARMAVSFRDRKLSKEEEDAVLDLISRTAGIQIVCIVDRDKEKEMAYRSVVEKTMSNVFQREGQFYRGTLRKRQVLETSSSVLILGDVEEGARVISKGSVIVIGTLSGSVYAGADGNCDAYVAALSMRPGKIRIGGTYIRKRLLQEEGLIGCGPQIAVADTGRIWIGAL